VVQHRAVPHGTRVTEPAVERCCAHAHRVGCGDLHVQLSPPQAISAESGRRLEWRCELLQSLLLDLCSIGFSSPRRLSATFSWRPFEAFRVLSHTLIGCHRCGRLLHDVNGISRSLFCHLSSHGKSAPRGFSLPPY
jgi:hypothetical protein